jgi:hypothetical protein
MATITWTNRAGADAVPSGEMFSQFDRAIEVMIHLQGSTQYVNDGEVRRVA